MKDIQTKYKKYQTMLNAEEDDCGFFLLASSSILSRVIKGEIDLSLWAKFVMADRGLNADGKWIGFDNAKKSIGIGGCLWQR